MLPDRVSNPGPLTYESSALPIGAQCSQWNVDYHIHPTLFRSVSKLCRTIFEKLDIQTLREHLVSVA